MKQYILVFPILFLSFHSLSQDYVSDSIMSILVDSGIANEKFQPNGQRKGDTRVGEWEDYSFEFLNIYKYNDDETVDASFRHLLIQSFGKYKNGQKEGVWQFNAVEIGTYKKYHVADIRFKKGKRNGPVTFYFSDGKKAAECTYKDNELDGEYTVYYKTGEVNRVGTIADGNLQGTLTYYYKSGAKRIVMLFKDGLQNGDYTSYYENGDLKAKRYYINDSIHGKSIVYYPNGQIQEEGMYDHGKPVYWKYFYNSGQLWVHREYKNGNLHNILELYDSRGKPLDFGTLKDGTGTVKYYTEEAKIYSIRTYKNGIIVDEQDFD